MNWGKRLDQLAQRLEDPSILTDFTDFERYLDDLLGVEAAKPLAIVRPSSSNDVSIVVQWCQSFKVRIVPQGGLTGLSGGAVSVGSEDYVIVSLERMNRVLSLDPLDQSIEVQSGVTLQAIREFAKEQDLYFPLVHGAGSSQIGGNLSTNSGGNNALRYGVARDQVMGLEVVLADGAIWNGMRNLRKNTAGYDLKHLFIGAEGSLGIITSARLKLQAYPHNRVTAFVAVNSPQAALELLRLLQSHVGEMISAYELCSAQALEFALKMDNTRYPFRSMHSWNILIEVESVAKGLDLERSLESGLAEGFEAELVADAIIAQSMTQRDELWHLRESIAAFFIEDTSSIKSDTAVPVSSVPHYLARCESRLAEQLNGIRMAPFGHLGDGNIHMNVIRPADMSAEDFLPRRDAIIRIIEEEALAYGGTISAEHGIGRSKKQSFLESADPTDLDMMRRIKLVMDEENLLNPGVIF